MKALRVAGLAILTTTIPVSTHAQEKPKFDLFFSGGLASPLSPELFNDGWKHGFGIGGGGSYRINPILSMEGRIEYDRFPLDPVDHQFGFAGTGFGLSFEFAGGDISILSVVGDLKLSILSDESRVSPYVLAGAGFGRMSVGSTTLDVVLTPYDLYTDPYYFDPRFYDIDGTFEGQSETAPLIAFGGGLDIRVSDRVTVFAEGRYQRLFSDHEPTDHGSIRGGIRVGL